VVKTTQQLRKIYSTELHEGVAESRDEFYFGITIRQEVHHSIHPGIQQRLGAAIAVATLDD
jgi:hypothetical protein